MKNWAQFFSNMNVHFNWMVGSGDDLVASFDSYKGMFPIRQLKYITNRTYVQ